MIRNESEYQNAVQRLQDQSQRLREQGKHLKELNLSKEEIKRVLDPVQSFSLQLQEEVQSYERLKRGEFDEIRNFESVGRLFVALRISQGITQQELAERLGVHESLVSRDERNEYHGITLDRAGRLLDALGVDTRTAVLSVGPMGSKPLVESQTSHALLCNTGSDVGSRAHKLLVEWALLRNAELANNWRRATNGESLLPVDPLD